jgi:S-adenosyl-L-methionine hydrolase (adenosine-forming)
MSGIAGPVTTPAAARTGTGHARPFISLTTDFGLRDPSAAICRGVIMSIAHDAIVLDLSHEIAKFAIDDASLVLESAVAYLPVGVHVAVVDPGVGTARRPLVLQVARGDMLVGPDNGLLVAAAERLGGIRAVHLLDNRDYQLPVVSHSFHGRDIFAPAAAHLALGVPPEAFGRSLDQARLIRRPRPVATAKDGALETVTVYVDTFGNVKLTGSMGELQAALAAGADGGSAAFGDTLVLEARASSNTPSVRAVARLARTFGEVEANSILVYEDSYGRLCVAENQGNAAERLGLSVGRIVRISRGRDRVASG